MLALAMDRYCMTWCWYYLDVGSGNGSVLRVLVGVACHMVGLALCAPFVGKSLAEIQRARAHRTTDLLSKIRSRRRRVLVF
jgi:hypothetical protein